VPLQSARASPPPARSSSVTGPFEKEPDRFRALRVRLSWSSCSHEHVYVGCPFFRHALPFGRTCGTGVATLPSVPSSGFLPLSTVPASTRLASRPFGPRRSPWPPTLRGLLSCRSRPWSVPSELSLPEEPYPLSRAVSSLRVRVRLPPAQSLQELHDRFPRFSRQLFAFEPARKRTRDS